MNTPAVDPVASVAPLFEPVTIAGVEQRNRIVMAPMTRRKAPDNRVPSDEIAAYYERRAAGGVGFILTEGTHIEPEHAPDSENVPGIWNDEQAEGWSKVIGRVHRAGGKIGCQLWHTGRLAMRPIAPSAIPAMDRQGNPRTTPKEMTHADIDALVAHFAHAAKTAKQAGFDSVEIHGAHGYILDTFVSPEANQRSDAFGGSFEQRIRVPLMVTEAVRAAVGPGYPVWYRFSQWRVDDAAALAYPDPQTLGTFVTALREAGVDVLHASTRDMTEPAFESDPKTLAGWTRELSGLPTVAVGSATLSGGMGDAGAMQTTDPAPLGEMIRRGEADLVAVGRALIGNPDWCPTVARGDWQRLTPYDPQMLERLD